MSARQCGTCTLCCKIFAVESLAKPAQTWCPHVQNEFPHGCGIYPTRPTTCRLFECLWLQTPPEMLPDDLKPEKTHVVLTPTKDGKTIMAHVDRAYPNPRRLLLTGAMGQFIQRVVAQGLLVIGIIGAERHLFFDERRIDPATRGRLEAALKALQAPEGPPS
jgi:hypothetical protein